LHLDDNAKKPKLSLLLDYAFASDLTYTEIWLELIKNYLDELALRNQEGRELDFTDATRQCYNCHQIFTMLKIEPAKAQEHLN